MLNQRVTYWLDLTEYSYSSKLLIRFLSIILGQISDKLLQSNVDSHSFDVE